MNNNNDDDNSNGDGVELPTANQRSINHLDGFPFNFLII